MSFYGSNWTVLIEDIQSRSHSVDKRRMRVERNIKDANERHNLPIEQSLDKVLHCLISVSAAKDNFILCKVDRWQSQIEWLSVLTGYTVPCLWDVWAGCIESAVMDGEDINKEWANFLSITKELDW